MEEPSDEELVSQICQPGRTAADQEAALRTLAGRYKSKLIGHVNNRVRNIPQFLSAVRRGSLEDFCADAVGQAIRTYRPGRKASFSTWLYEIVRNDITSGLRVKNLPQSMTDREGRNVVDQAEGPSLAPGSFEHLGLLTALDLARACLRKMDDRSRRVFLWAWILRFSSAELREIWPQESDENLKQLKHRSLARFLKFWAAAGGEKTERLLQSAAGAVADRIDPDQIKDKHAREAYRTWVRKGSLESAALELGLEVEPLRKLLLGAMHDLFEQGQFRGGLLGWGGRRLGLRDMARLVELVDGNDGASAVASPIAHTLEVVRASFGFAPAECATHTLGSFLQGRLATEKDYEAACKKLQLAPTMLRKLLSGEFDPRDELFERLADFLGVSAEDLRVLPLRQAGGTRVALRSRSGFDTARFLRRLQAWIGK